MRDVRLAIVAVLEVATAFDTRAEGARDRVAERVLRKLVQVAKIQQDSVRTLRHADATVKMFDTVAAEFASFAVAETTDLEALRNRLRRAVKQTVLGIDERESIIEKLTRGLTRAEIRAHRGPKEAAARRMAKAGLGSWRDIFKRQADYRRRHVFRFSVRAGVLKTRQMTLVPAAFGRTPERSEIDGFVARAFDERIVRGQPLPRRTRKP